MQRMKRHLSYANVMSTIAVFFAISGATAFAATQIAKNSVGSKQLKKNAVTSVKIKKNAVTNAKIKKSAVTNAKIKNGAVTGVKIKNGTISGSKINLPTLGAVPLASGLAGLHRAGWVRVAATSGADYDSARIAAPEVPLTTVGPFTAYGKCFTFDTRVYSIAYIRTSEGGSLLDSDDDHLHGDPFLEPDTAENDRELMYDWASPDSATFYGVHTSEFIALSPSGVTMRGDVSVGAKMGTLAGGNGIWGDGDSCIFSGTSIQLNQ